MTRYRNLSGDSGVESYRIRDDAIDVRFRENAQVYTYSWKRPGRDHVEAMKRLAKAGRGLSSYISRYVRDEFEARH
jgi:hypothetical protein